MRQAKPVAGQHMGIVLDRPPEEVDPTAWTGARNVAFADGNTYRVGGYVRFADPLPATGPLFALNVIVGAESYWMYVTTSKVYVTDGLTHWDITPASGISASQPGDWSGCVLNGIPVLNNGTDMPFYWDRDNTHPCATLPGWPTTARCKAIRASKYHLIALNITDTGVNYGSQVWWSSGAQAGALPQEWTPTASNDAGDVICADSPGDIIDGLALRDMFIVYKAFSTYIMQYVAGAYVFTTRKLFETTGIQALNCVIEANGLHYVFTGTDVISHDGQTYNSLADEKVKTTLVKSIEPSKVKVCSVSARILADQVWVCIPETGHTYLSKAYVVDTVTGDWGVRDLPELAAVCRGVVGSTGQGNSWTSDNATWDSDTTFWDQQAFSPTQDSILFVDQANSHLFNADGADTADGSPIYAYVERLGTALGDFDMHKVVTGIVPRIEGGDGETLTITLGGQPWFDTPITWGDPQTFVIGQDHQVDSIVEGRLLSVRIEGTTNSAWRFFRYAVNFAPSGRY